jgi:hypothetical protein
VTGGPYCGGDVISGGRVEVEGRHATQEVDCFDCGATWGDVYTLSAVDVLDEQGRYAGTLDGSGPAPIEDLLADGAMPGEATRPVMLGVARHDGGGDAGSWRPETVAVPRRVPEGRLGQAATHLLRIRLAEAWADVDFVGVLSSPASGRDGRADPGGDR